MTFMTFMTLLCLASSDWLIHVTVYFHYFRYMVEVRRIYDNTREDELFTGIIYRISIFRN